MPVIFYCRQKNYLLKSFHQNYIFFLLKKKFFLEIQGDHKQRSPEHISYYFFMENSFKILNWSIYKYTLSLQKHKKGTLIFKSGWVWLKYA